MGEKTGGCRRKAKGDLPIFGCGSIFAGGTGEVDRASAVGAKLAVPTVAIARDPGVDFAGEPADARDEKNPTEVAPTREEQTDAGPRFDATRDAPARVDGLHPAHGQPSVDLRETFLCGGVVEVEEFDAMTRVEALNGSDAGATQAAGAVVENEEVGRVLWRCGHYACLMANGGSG